MAKYATGKYAKAISDRSDLYNDKFNDFLIVRTIENIFT